jgi:HD-like signal output (HDOD) protein/signal transduction histidine kinase
LNSVPGAVLDAIEPARLQPMPQVLLRFLRMTEDDRASMNDLAKVALQDPALSAHVLMAANAAAVGRGQQLKSLDQCLRVLGMCLVRTLAASLSIQSVFARMADDQVYDLAGFWRHSLQVAEIARAIAVKLERDDFEECYLAGLLHDTGQLLLLGGLGDRYGALLDWSGEEEALVVLERKELGTDHAAVGAWLLDQWKLPSFMADAVLFHHAQPGQIPSADRLSQIVWSAHAVSAWQPAEDGSLNGRQQFEAEAMESMLSLPAGSLVSLHRQSFARVAELASTLAINAPPNSTPLPRSSQASVERSRLAEQGDAWNQIEAAVCDMALMEPLRHNLFAAESESDALEVIGQVVRILFGIDRLAFLLPDEDRSSLSGAALDSQPALLQQLVVPLEAGSSQVAIAVLGKEPRSTFSGEGSQPASLVDVQIVRCLGTEGVLYVPMYSGDTLIGVMAYGLGKAQLSRTRNRLGWLISFTRLATVSVMDRREVLAQRKRIETELTSQFQHQARQVAHEAGNPLSIITNYLNTLAERLPDGSGVHQELDILKEEIDRVGLIVRRLGEIPVQAPENAQVDINAVIEGMAALYRESLFSSRDISLDLFLDEHLAAIPGSRDQIKQILLNLWKNASEALPVGGRFVVKTAGRIHLSGRDYAEIRLTDTGPGLPSDVDKYLFQPLSPMRRPGHAGMGLSIVAALVKALGGQITTQSRAGQGTTFVILLPMS